MENEPVRRNSGDFHQLRDDDMGRELEAREVSEMGDPLLLNDEAVALREIAFIEGELRRGHPDREGLGMALLDWMSELALIRGEKAKRRGE
jgi:hypothetical protein